MSSSKWGTAVLCFLFLFFSAVQSGAEDVAESVRRATVRIKHFRGNLVATSSGTVIARSGSDVIVATCAHGFHEGKGPFDVEVTFYTKEGPLYRSGQTMGFDYHLDVGLVRVSNAPNTPYIPPLERGTRAKVAEKVFVAGCDGGGKPMVKVTRVTAVGRFAGRPNIQVSAVPEDGRSGGALVTTRGFLLGVCNGIDSGHNEGMYAGVEALYRLQDPDYRPLNASPPKTKTVVTATPAHKNYYLRIAGQQDKKPAKKR